jgi:hypothetical protein
MTLLLDAREKLDGYFKAPIDDKTFQEFYNAVMSEHKPLIKYVKTFAMKLIKEERYEPKVPTMRVGPTSTSGAAGREARSPSLAREASSAPVETTRATLDGAAAEIEASRTLQEKLNVIRRDDEALYSDLSFETTGTIRPEAANQALEYAQKNNFPKNRYLLFIRAVKGQGRDGFEKEKKRIEDTQQELKCGVTDAANALYEPIVTSSGGDSEPGILDRLVTKFQKDPLRWSIGIGVSAAALLAIAGGTFIYLKQKKTVETDLNNPVSG